MRRPYERLHGQGMQKLERAAPEQYQSELPLGARGPPGAVQVAVNGRMSGDSAGCYRGSERSNRALPKRPQHGPRNSSPESDYPTKSVLLTKMPVCRMRR